MEDAIQTLRPRKLTGGGGETTGGETSKGQNIHKPLCTGLSEMRTKTRINFDSRRRQFTREQLNSSLIRPTTPVIWRQPHTHTELLQHNFKGSPAIVPWSSRGVASGRPMQEVMTYFITIKLQHFKFGFNLPLHYDVEGFGSDRTSPNFESYYTGRSIFWLDCWISNANRNC